MLTVNCIEANMAILQLLRQKQLIDIDHRTAFDLAKVGGFLSVHINQTALNERIEEMKTMSTEDRCEFRRHLARIEETDLEQYPVLASN
jgi:hypothetical protein